MIKICCSIFTYPLPLTGRGLTDVLCAGSLINHFYFLNSNLRLDKNRTTTNLFIGSSYEKVNLFQFVFVLSIFVFPQDKNYKTTALSFSFNGFNLSSYYGGVGARFWITDSTVFNLSIGGSYSQKEYHATENLEEGLEKNSAITLGIGFESHYPISENLSPYLSFRGSYTMYNRYYRPGYDDYESKDRINSFSFDFGLGVEYWIVERISLSGQHLLIFI